MDWETCMIMIYNFQKVIEFEVHAIGYSLVIRVPVYLKAWSDLQQRHLQNPELHITIHRFR